MSSYKLTYFNAAGRAEPVRIAFFIAGVPFEDDRVAFPEFASLKESGALPLGSVPVLAVDGFSMVQTSPMLRYVARLGDTGLYPADPLRAFVVDSALDSFNDTLSNALSPSYRERDMEKKLAMRAELANTTMKRVFEYVEGLLAKFGGPFLGGPTLSIADLVVAGQIVAIRGGHLDGITTEHVVPYKRLLALTDAYLAEPRIVAYHASRG